MSRNRFKELRQCLTIGTAPLQADANDPWWRIRPFVDAFNENRSRSVIPGEYLTVDEIMSMWLGLESTYSTNGLPHTTKIARKPRGVGAEMKAVCCSTSNIMLRIEMLRIW